MLYYKNNKYNISKLVVNYIQDGEELTNAVGQEGKQWWLDFEEKWDNMTITEFLAVDITDEELLRLEKVNELAIPEGHSEVLGNYVRENKFPDEANHVLNNLENKITNESNQNYFVDLDFRMSMSEMGM